MRLHLLSTLLVTLTALPTAVSAEEYKIEASKEPPPEALAAPVRDVLQPQGYRVVDGEGKVYAEVWLRKAVPASSAPSGPKGAILLPFLAEGELLGALRYPGEGHDNRDQTIAKGVYTLRYGLQPVNGDHLGISTHRDYTLLLPVAKDKSLAPVEKKPLETTSAEAAGTSHPAILMLVAPKSGAKPLTMVHDEAKDTWGAVVPLSLEVKGASGPATQNVQIVVIGVFGS